jgi:hypothetical protein
MRADGRVEAVLNERSRRDPWAKIAKWCLPGARPSGLVRFREGGDFIVDREFRRRGTAASLTSCTTKKSWVPFLLGETHPSTSH